MKLLIAVDGSPASSRALEWVAALPASPSREAILLTVQVHASDPMMLLADGGIELLPSVEEEEADASLAWSKARLNDAGIPTRSVFRKGASAVHEILAVAEEVGAELIVVGCQHKSAIGRLLLGSVSVDLALKARIPLLIVP